MIRTSKLAHLAAVTAIAAGSVTLSAAAAHAATTYKVSGTDGTLAEQSIPYVNNVTGWLHEGDSVQVVCQINNGGQDLGDGGTFTWQQSRTWDQLTNGTWVYDHFITTPAQGSDGYSPGVPHCTNTSTLDPTKYPWTVSPSAVIPDGHGYEEGECVSFAAWALRTDGLPHTKGSDGLGNADMWTGAYSTSAPAVGEIAQWDDNHNGAGSYGHVAYVAAVNSNGTIKVYEYNWIDSYDGYTAHRLSIRTIPASDPSRYLHF